MRWELLDALSSEELDRVLAQCLVRRFARREVLFHAGDLADTLFFLAEGHVAVRVVLPSGETGTLTVLGPGQTFGELALLRRSARRTASVVALDDCRVLALHRDRFEALRAQHRAFERLLVSLLAARVDRLSRHLVEALYLPVERRLARRLLELVRLYREHDDLPVVVPLTQDDLAGLAGTTRPTASDALRELERRGVVTLGRGAVTVRDLAGLAAAGGLDE